MVLPEAETQRPSTLSFPAFANQFEELERVQSQHRAAAYFHNAYAPFHAASPTNRAPLTIRNINAELRNLPLPPSPSLQPRIDGASSITQEPTPGTRGPNGVLRTTGEVSPRLPHLRIRNPNISNPSHNPPPPPRPSNPHTQNPSPRPNRTYTPSRPAPPPPPLAPSSSAPVPTPTSPLPPSPVTRHLISIYALSVRPGDILAYGNKLNHGCTVTACYPDERRPDLVLRNGGTGGDEGEEGEEGDGGDGRDEGRRGDEGEVGPPVKMNGGIRIRWKDGETGEELSQLFEGLEVLQVRRGEMDEGEESEEGGYW